MVSIRRHVSPVGTSKNSPTFERAVNFPVSPVTSISRPISNEEHWALWRFEEHALNCNSCHDPYKIHKAGKKLCECGHKRAVDVASNIFFRRSDSGLYSYTTGDYKEVRVEIPAGYDESLGLLKAIARARKHNTIFVSCDRTYLVKPRGIRRSGSPDSSTSSKSSRQSRKSTSTNTSYSNTYSPQRDSSSERPYVRHSATMPMPVQMPEPYAYTYKPTDQFTESLDSANRGSLYSVDKAAYWERKQQEQRLGYSLEVREPSKVRDSRRRSTFIG